MTAEELLEEWSTGGDVFLVDHKTSTVVAIGAAEYLAYFTREPRSSWAVLEWHELSPEMLEKLRDIAELMSDMQRS